jgi:alanine dehydrogenase
MYVPCEREDGYYRWGTAEGTNDGIFSIRMKSDVITWPVGNDGLWRENKYCINVLWLDPACSARVRS